MPASSPRSLTIYGATNTTGIQVYDSGGGRTFGISPNTSGDLVIQEDGGSAAAIQLLASNWAKLFGAGVQIVTELQLAGTGSNASKCLRSGNAGGGPFEILNSAHSATILQLTDAGVITLANLGGSGSAIVCTDASGVLSRTGCSISGTGTVTSSGAPVANQLAPFSSSTDITGSSTLSSDGTTLATGPGDLRHLEVRR